MKDYTIDLKPDEKAILDQTEFHPRALKSSDEARRNGALAGRLMRLLSARQSAIPAHRIRWFTDPAYFIGGRGSSRKNVFERRGIRGDAILEHPHFLAHLRYFIHGPQLPPAVMNEFAARIVACGQGYFG